jgi:hypothetical protein
LKDGTSACRVLAKYSCGEPRTKDSASFGQIRPHGGVNPCVRGQVTAPKRAWNRVVGWPGEQMARTRPSWLQRAPDP